MGHGHGSQAIGLVTGIFTHHATTLSKEVLKAHLASTLTAVHNCAYVYTYTEILLSHKACNLEYSKSNGYFTTSLPFHFCGAEGWLLTSREPSRDSVFSITSLNHLRIPSVVFFFFNPFLTTKRWAEKVTFLRNDTLQGLLYLCSLHRPIKTTVHSHEKSVCKTI